MSGCRARNPDNCRYHATVKPMSTITVDDEYASLVVPGNVAALPGLGAEDRVCLTAELRRVNEKTKHFHYNYDLAPASSTRPGEEEFLRSYNPSKYGLTPDAVVDTADNVVFTRGGDGRLKVLLIQRKNHPFKGYWCTPGGFVDAGEDPHTAAARELEEETGVEVPAEGVQFVKTYDHPWRDGRMEHLRANAHVAFIPHLTVFSAADDAADAALVDVGDVFASSSPIRVGFDHRQLIADAVQHLLS